MKNKSRKHRNLEQIYSQLTALDDAALYVAYCEGEQRIKKMRKSRNDSDFTLESEKYTLLNNILTIIASEIRKRTLLYKAKDSDEDTTEMWGVPNVEVDFIEGIESERIEKLIKELSKIEIVKPFPNKDISLLLDEYKKINKLDPLRDVNNLYSEFNDNPVEPAVVARLHFSLVCNTSISYKLAGAKNEAPQKTNEPIYTFFRRNLIKGVQYSSETISGMLSLFYNSWKDDFDKLYKLHLRENKGLNKDEIMAIACSSDFANKSKKFLYDFIKGIDYMEYGEEDEKNLVTTKVFLELTNPLKPFKYWDKERSNKSNRRPTGSVSYKDTIRFIQAKRPPTLKNTPTKVKNLPIYLKSSLTTIPSIVQQIKLFQEAMHPTRPKGISDMGVEYSCVEDPNRTLKKPSKWDKKRFKESDNTSGRSSSTYNQQKTFKYADGRKITIKRKSYSASKWEKIKSLKSGEDWDKFQGK